MKKETEQASAGLPAHEYYFLVKLPARYTMRIGLLSDTHSFYEPRLDAYLAEVDEIWHAGDIGDRSVIEQLEKHKPVRAVYGNIDDAAARAQWPEDLWLEINGLTIWMTHIAGAPPGFNSRVKNQLTKRQPHVLICGHSHICRVHKDEVTGLIYLNPGAAGNHGFHRTKTMMRFTIDGGKLYQLEVIELGKRGSLP